MLEEIFRQERGVSRALERWPTDGIPERPAAWLTTVARRRLVDLQRRRPAARADLLRRAEEARAADEQALALGPSPAEAACLRRRIEGTEG